VPDDAHAVVGARDAVRPGSRRAADLRTASRGVRVRAFEDLDPVDALALPQRNLAEPAAEAAVEREREQLGDLERAVALDLDGDVGLGKLE